MCFQCIVNHVSHKMSYQSTGSYIWIFTVLSTRCHTKGLTNLQVLIYMSLLYLSARCHTKGPTNLQVLIYGFQCIIYQVSNKRSYQSTGSYIRVFSVLPTRCHTKGPTNPQVHKSEFLVYCLPGVTQKVLPIYRFLYMGFYCIVYQVSHKSSYQSAGSYIRFLVYQLPGVTQKILPIYRFLYKGFCVLPTRCHTKSPTNLQGNIYGCLVYRLPGVTQKVLPIYRYLYTSFQCIVYQVSHKR